MSLVLAFLRWLFGRRLSAAERYRVWAIDYAGWLMLEVEKDWFHLQDPGHRAWLTWRLWLIEQRRSGGRRGAARLWRNGCSAGSSPRPFPCA